MATKTYQVESPVRHDGKEYSVGDSIDLDDKEAKDLLAVKAISGAGNASSAPPDDEAERIAAIAEAISKLDEAQSDNWTTSGKPQIPAIEAITGWPVAGKDRDAAWAQIKPAA